MPCVILGFICMCSVQSFFNITGTNSHITINWPKHLRKCCFAIIPSAIMMYNLITLISHLRSQHVFKLLHLITILSYSSSEWTDKHHSAMSMTRSTSSSKHRFPAPSSKLCQNWLRHWRGTLYLRAAVHWRGQRPPKGSGTNMTVEAT